MRISIACGGQGLELEVADDRWIPTRPAPPPLADPVRRTQEALEKPLDYPALRRALTPDDQVAVLVDDRLPGLPALLVPVLDHILEAGVRPEAITLLGAPGSTQLWWGDLPERLRSVGREVHDPDNRGKLAYLASTAGGKRLYLNRTLVDAAQAVVLGLRRFDPLLGQGGAEGDIYPGLGDRETREQMAGQTRSDVPGDEPWPLRREAVEVSWLLGQPFFIQCIDGPGDTLSHIVAGAGEATREGQRLLEECWKQVVPRRAELVVASLAGDPARHTFADLARAAACAARVVEAGGRIVLLAGSRPDLPAGIDVMRQEDDPADALKELGKNPSLERLAAVQWAEVAGAARLTLWSGLEDDLVEELYATPLGSLGEVQRLVGAARSCLFLEDAHKMLAVVA